MSAVTEKLLTAEEFSLLPDKGRLCELVRGRLADMNHGDLRHGYCCAIFGVLLCPPDRGKRLGRVVINNAAVITERDPDTVRGPDIAFYSFKRLAPGPMPDGYLD